MLAKDPRSLGKLKDPEEPLNTVVILGKVRSSQIKRLARQLLEKYPDLMTKDFQKNKEILKSILKTRSKRVRNRVAGYVAHLKKVVERAAQMPRREGREEIPSP